MKYKPIGELHTDGLLVEFGAIFTRSAVIAAVAAQNSQAQLYNPVGSGIDAQLLECWVSLATAGDIWISDYSTQLTTSDGVGLATHNTYGNGASLVRHQTNAGLLGTNWMRFSLPANQSVMVPGPKRIQLGAGKGFIVQAVTVNVAMNVGFVWYEP